MTAAGPATCIDCGEPDPGYADGRCRECELDFLLNPKRPRRFLFCGSRHWTDPAPIEAALRSLPRHSTILHGGCPTGADALADVLARRLGVRVEVFPADWNRHGKAAGPRRNAEMVASKPDLVIAFGTGRGTADCVRRARAAGIEVRRVA